MPRKAILQKDHHQKFDISRRCLFFFFFEISKISKRKNKKKKKNAPVIFFSLVGFRFLPSYSFAAVCAGYGGVFGWEMAAGSSICAKKKHQMLSIHLPLETLHLSLLPVWVDIQQRCCCCCCCYDTCADH